MSYGITREEQYRQECLEAVERGEVTATLYRRGALVVGWPSYWPKSPLERKPRGIVLSQSRRSLIRASFHLANSPVDFDMMSTLTFRVPHGTPKTCLRTWIRDVLGLRCDRDGYGWVQEYQERGVVHYHVLWRWEESWQGRRGLEPQFRQVRRGGRVRWVLAGESDAELSDKWVHIVGDNSPEFWAFQHGGVHEAIEEPEKAGLYLGAYAGKSAQKKLPDEEAPAGRWWYLSNAARIVPRGTGTLISWEAKRPFHQVYDARKLDLCLSAESTEAPLT